MHQDDPNDDDADLPKMNPQLDTYFAEIRGKMSAGMPRGLEGPRTSEHTVTDFTLTKRERFWKMKLDGQLVDSVLITADGHQEFLHLDALLALEREEGMKPFYQKADSDGTSAHLDQYKVDSSISTASLEEVIYFAYHRRCTIQKENALEMAFPGIRSHLGSLPRLCILFLLHEEAGSSLVALQAYQVAVDSENDDAAKLLQTFIEDAFEMLWTHHRTAVLEMSFSAISKVLSWDRLDIEEETTLWLVIESWINAHRDDRLVHLPSLIKQCLRIGRLSRTFFDETIRRCATFSALSPQGQAQVTQYFNILTDALSRGAIIDGHGLLYKKDIADFRPRDARHLLVAAGGKSESDRLRSIEVYDPKVNMWQSISLQLPGHFSDEIQFLNGLLYRWVKGRQLFALDLTQATPTWEEKCPMLKERRSLSSVALDGYLYVLGGDSSCKACERYCPTVDRWEAIADLPVRHHPFALKRPVAAFQGRIFQATGGHFSPKIKVYSPQTNTWQLIDGPRFSWHASTFSLLPFGNRLWILIDHFRDGVLCKSYHPETNSWLTECTTVHRFGASATVFNGKLMLAGGRGRTQLLFPSPSNLSLSNADKAEQRIVRSTLAYSPDQGWTEAAPLSQERQDFYLFSVPNEYPLFRP